MIDAREFFGAEPPPSPPFPHDARHGNFFTPWRDVACLARLGQLRPPRRYLEVGCNRGHTLRWLADLWPECRLVGCDPGQNIPADARNPQQAKEYPSPGEIGLLVHGHPRVTIRRRRFDDLLDAGFDAIFVDGDHRREAVAADTLGALGRLNPGGWIAWHDVGNSETPGVAEALAECGLPIVHVSGTWIAYYLSGLTVSPDAS